MTQQRAPRLAAALLDRFSADRALIGDVLEEYERRRSRIWLWRQVTAAVAVELTGRARDTQPHRWKAVNLTAAPRGSAVGGPGLLALAVLIVIVLPQAWWLLAIGAAGGIGLGTTMVIISRRRERRRPTGVRRHTLLPVLLLIVAWPAGSALSSQQPVAAVRLDPIEGIANAFTSHQVVMLPGGHGSKPFHDLLLSLARDTRIHADKDRYTIRGVEEFVKIPREQHRPMRMEDQVDAIIWNGNAPPKAILLSKETCADPAYLPMRLARIAVGGLPQGEADAVKRACAVHKF